MPGLFQRADARTKETNATRAIGRVMLHECCIRLYPRSICSHDLCACSNDIPNTLTTHEDSKQRQIQQTLQFSQNDGERSSEDRQGGNSLRQTRVHRHASHSAADRTASRVCRTSAVGNG